MTPLHDKIQKILRLAANEGATEGEREAALKAAQSLAFKHNLDLSQVDFTEEPKNAIGDHETSDYLESTWEKYLLETIAVVNFCRVWYWDHSYERRDRLQAVIVGRPHNVDVVRQMYSFIRPQVEEQVVREISARGQNPRYALIACLNHAVASGLATLGELTVSFIEPGLKQWRLDILEEARQLLIPELGGDEGLNLLMLYTGLTKSYASEIRPFIKQNRLAPEVVADLKVWRHSFEIGIAQRVQSRLYAEFRRLEEDAGTSGTDLVTRESQALDEYMAQKEFDKGHTGTERQVDAGGLRSGRAAGDKITLQERGTLTNTSGKELNR